MKNIKEIIESNKEIPIDLPKNHRKRFENKLQQELHTKKSKYLFLKIAASFLLLISIGYISYQILALKQAEEQYTLASISPELKKIENYYTNAIAHELTQIEINEENQLILEKYFKKLDELTTQYKKQSAQLNIDKINEENINALIDNLQFRLQLLLQLKEQLKTIKDKKNEKHKI